VTSNKRDPCGQLTVTDLQLIAGARGLDVPAGAERDEIVVLLRAHDVEASTTPPRNPTMSAPPECIGWWTSMSIPELRMLARDHSIDVQAGMHRRELVALLVEHDVRRPSGQTSGRRRRSR
jgi:hypothetical protein